MTAMTDELVDRLVRLHRETVMEGWDFSRLDGRMHAEEPPWGFDDDCLTALAGAGTALDMGTGGGERLLRLWHRLPAGRRPRLLATEGWEPNVAVARRALAPAGIEVLPHDPETGEPMPLPDGCLDVVMNRHEAYDPAEVARVLRPGGTLLTQQVDCRDAAEVRQWFGGEPAYPDIRLDVQRPLLEAAGFEVHRAEQWRGVMVFADVDALVTYLALVPWDVPGLQLADHGTVLHELAARGPITLTQRRWRLYAVRSGDDAPAPAGRTDSNSSVVVS